MATYFINASGTNTYPYDTPTKGATNFTTFGEGLTANEGSLASDIIEVVKNGPINDSAAGFSISCNGTS